MPREEDPELLCLPKSMRRGAGWVPLKAGGTVRVSPASSLWQAAQGFCHRLQVRTGLAWAVRANACSTAFPVDVAVGTGLGLRPGGFRLRVEPEGIRVEGSDRAGALYGLFTLEELVNQYGTTLPILDIEDEPTFAVRGFLLDISRSKVPTMETLRTLVDLLAHLRINHLELYMEHTFAYSAHWKVWKDASPLTGEDILELDAYAREREVELVPNQNCLGHLTPWLRHAPYRDLAEAPEGSQFPWGYVAEPFSLSPVLPGSLALVTELLQELLPHFTSSLAHIGFDEAYDVGQGKSREEVERLGRGHILTRFLSQVAQVVRDMGRTPLAWADMFTRHHPEELSRLPEDVVLCEWGYEADYPFHKRLEPLARAGRSFYVCPGTSTWLSFTGRGSNAVDNLHACMDAAQTYGAQGILLTDWGDRGHMQPWATTYAPLAYGAALMWNPKTPLDAARERALGRLLGDPTGAVGQVLWAYQRLHRAHDGETAFGHQAAPLALALLYPASIPAVAASFGPQAREALRDDLRRLEEELGAAPVGDGEGERLRAELRHAGQALDLAVEVLEEGGLGRRSQEALQAWEEEYRRLWSLRFRPGGLSTSLSYLDALRQSAGPVGA